jgi:pyruvate/2-oxoglutarate dehydrogenase complex dihydrolipoamide dehydrogenase (E3) component
MQAKTSGARSIHRNHGQQNVVAEDILRRYLGGEGRALPGGGFHPVLRNHIHSVPRERLLQWPVAPSVYSEAFGRNTTFRFHFLNSVKKGDGIYNLVVIGAGTAGLVTAAGSVALGARVALVERNQMGGDCLNFGCVPSKALISSTRLLHRIRHAQPWGIEASEPVFNFQTVFAKMRAARAELAPLDSQERFESLGVDVFRGEATFLSPQALVIGDEKLRARHFVIATGSRAAIPPVIAASRVPYFTNETIFDELKEKPKSLLIVGGGPIGCELGQMFGRLGVKVTIVQRGPRLLSKEDPAASEFVQARLEAEDVRIQLGFEIEEATETARGVTLRAAGHSVSASALLIAAGRQPNVEKLNLSQANVSFTEHGVTVNDYLETSQPGIYAIGDIVGQLQFTHVADYHARIAIRNTLVPFSFLRQKVDYSVVPWCTYLDPEVATVGLTESRATKGGIKYDLIEQEMKAVDRAVVERAEAGFARVLVKHGSDEILGATIVGEHAGELIQQFVLAMKHGIGLKQIASTIYAYPTFASLVLKSAEKFNRKRLTPRARAITGWLYRRSRKE